MVQSANSGSITNSPTAAGKFLTFALAQERYGVEILAVQEIIGVPAITRVPRSPGYIKGVMNLRGKIVPVIDLREKFAIAPVPYDDKTCVIVMNIAFSKDVKFSVGVVVDTVLEVIEFSTKDVEPAPEYGVGLDNSCILGIGRKHDAPLNILIQMDKVLAIGDSGAISSLISTGD